MIYNIDYLIYISTLFKFILFYIINSFTKNIYLNNNINTSNIIII